MVGRKRAIIFLAAAMAALAFAPAAHSAPMTNVEIFVTFNTNPIAVGQTGTGTIEITNISTPETSALEMDNLDLEPQCEAVTSPPCPVASRDPGVFSLSNGTGGIGTGCFGTTFAVGPSPPAFGPAFRFTPSPAPLTLAVPEAGNNDMCRVNFTYTALKVPALDGQPGEPGIQTNQNVTTQWHSTTDFGPVEFSGNFFTTVVPAPPPAQNQTAAVTAATPPAPTAKKCKKKKRRSAAVAKKRCKKKK